jgi:hypothetical protein
LQPLNETAVAKLQGANLNNLLLDGEIEATALKFFNKYVN